MAEVSMTLRMTADVMGAQIASIGQIEPALARKIGDRWRDLEALGAELVELVEITPDHVDARLSAVFVGLCKDMGVSIDPA